MRSPGGAVKVALVEDSFRHEALFYSGEDGLPAGTLPFVTEALAGRRTGARGRRRAARGAAQARARRGRRARALRRHARARAQSGPGDPGVARVRRRARRRRAPGARASANRSGRGAATQSSTSASATRRCSNVAFAYGPAWRLLCPYDLDELDAEQIRAARVTHPALMHEGDQPSQRRLPAAAPRAERLHRRAARARRPSARSSRSPFAGWARCAAWSSRAGRAGGAGREAREDLVLAVNELVTNSVQYGGGGGTLRIWSEPDALVCDVRDRGYIDDPLVGRMPPPLDQHGGRGLWLVNQLCDLVQIRSTPNGTVVRVRMRADRPTPLAARQAASASSRRRRAGAAPCSCASVRRRRACAPPRRADRACARAGRLCPSAARRAARGDVARRSARAPSGFAAARALLVDRPRGDLLGALLATPCSRSLCLTCSYCAGPLAVPSSRRAAASHRLVGCDRRSERHGDLLYLDVCVCSDRGYRRATVRHRPAGQRCTCKPRAVSQRRQAPRRVPRQPHLDRWPRVPGAGDVRRSAARDDEAVRRDCRRDHRGARRCAIRRPVVRRAAAAQGLKREAPRRAVAPPGAVRGRAGEPARIGEPSGENAVRYDFGVGAQEHLRVDARSEQDRVVLHLDGRIGPGQLADLRTRAGGRGARRGAAGRARPRRAEVRRLDRACGSSCWRTRARAARGQEFAITPGSPQVQRLLSITSVAEHMRVIASPDDLLV